MNPVVIHQSAISVGHTVLCDVDRDIIEVGFQPVQGFTQTYRCHMEPIRTGPGVWKIFYLCVQTVQAKSIMVLIPFIMTFINERSH